LLDCDRGPSRSLLGAQFIAGVSEARNPWGVMGYVLDLTIVNFDTERHVDSFVRST
jgi:hypothetical protein